MSRRLLQPSSSASARTRARPCVARSRCQAHATPGESSRARAARAAIAGVEELEALLPAGTLPHPSDQIARLPSHEVVELDHPIAELVHRHAEHRMRPQWGEAHLHALLEAAVLDEGVAVVERGDEGRVPRGRARTSRARHRQLR